MFTIDLKQVSLIESIYYDTVCIHISTFQIWSVCEVDVVVNSDYVSIHRLSVEGGTIIQLESEQQPDSLVTEELVVLSLVVVALREHHRLGFHSATDACDL